MTTSRLTYSELMKLGTFEERFDYLNLQGRIGELTFGHNRYLNQVLYHSPEWRSLRNEIIARDNGCDLGVEGRDIFHGATIHHLNPITVDMVLERHPSVMDPENLVCVSRETHKAIHYGRIESTMQDYKPRSPGDTCPWKEAT